ncbi:hypothetical protein HID58_061687, partial [Brassica napus]
MSRQTPNLESSHDSSSNADSSQVSGSESFKPSSSNGSQDVKLNNSVSLSFCSSNSVSSEANLEKSQSFDTNEAAFKRITNSMYPTIVLQASFPQ